MAIKLAPRNIMVVPQPQVIAILHGCEGGRQRQDAQAMLWQLQLADDLRAQQAYHVREFGELKTWKNLLGHRRAANEMPPLQDHHLFAGLCEVCSSHQAIVAPTNNDHIISIGI